MNSELSLQDWLSYIENLHFKSVDLGLDRVRNIAVELDLLHPALVVVLVGGTNGKGTTCCFLEHILLDYGAKVGVYSSPHLVSYTERLRINGEELSESLHVESLSVINDARSCRPLTYFEFITLSNLYLLKRYSLDVVILEVGLGGRLDATNVVNPDISIVINVAVDHIDFLGSDYLGIAKEKFGIFRIGKPAIVGDFKYFSILKKIIFDWYGVNSFVKNADWFFHIDGDQWSWWDMSSRLDRLLLPKIPIENAAVALAALRFFPFSISRDSIDYASNMAVLPGRFQIIARSPFIILDVAHNPHAAVFLFSQLKMMNILGRFRIVVGMLSSKNIFDTLRVLDNLTPIWYFVSLDCILGASASDLAACVKNGFIFQTFTSAYEAFNQAVLESDDKDCIVVYGSFHTVAPIFKSINKNNSL